MPSLLNEFLGSFLAIVCVRKFPKEPTSLLCPQCRRNLPEIVNFFVCCSWSSILKCTVGVKFFALEIKRCAKQPFRVPVPRSRQHHHIVKPYIPYIRFFSKNSIYTEYTTCRRPYMPTQTWQIYYDLRGSRLVVMFGLNYRIFWFFGIFSFEIHPVKFGAFDSELI